MEWTQKVKQANVKAVIKLKLFVAAATNQTKKISRLVEYFQLLI